MRRSVSRLLYTLHVSRRCCSIQRPISAARPHRANNVSQRCRTVRQVVKNGRRVAPRDQDALVLHKVQHGRQASPPSSLFFRASVPLHIDYSRPHHRPPVPSGGRSLGSYTPRTLRVLSCPRRPSCVNSHPTRLWTHDHRHAINNDRT